MRKLNLLLKYLNQLDPLSFIKYLFQRFIKKEGILLIKVPHLSTKVLLRNNPSDIQVFTQVFIQQEYNVRIDKEIKTIIDCGANIGLASLFFLSKFPDARIIAIEPEENNFHILKQNLKYYKNVTCIKKGLWNKAANLEIIDNGWGEAGFVIEESPIPSEKTIQAISIEEIIDQFHLSEIDILKIDIEGSEEQVFLNASKWINKINIIFCEIHENLKPGLTNKIESQLNSDFNFIMHGEYHVFKRKYI